MPPVLSITAPFGCDYFRQKTVISAKKFPQEGNVMLSFWMFQTENSQTNYNTYIGLAVILYVVAPFLVHQMSLFYRYDLVVSAPIFITLYKIKKVKFTL